LRSPFVRLEDWDASVQYAEKSLMAPARVDRGSGGRQLGSTSQEGSSVGS